MVYTSTITTAANTLKSQRTKTKLKMTKGFIYQFDLYFPPGSMGLMYVQVQDKTFQLWPTTIDDWFKGNDIQISFPESYLLYNEPFELDVYTYNLDTAFAHDIQLRVGIVTEEIFIARFLPSVSLDMLKEVVSAMQLEKERAMFAQRSNVSGILSDYNAFAEEDMD